MLLTVAAAERQPSPSNIALGVCWPCSSAGIAGAAPIAAAQPITALKLIWRVAVDVFNSNLDVARIIWIDRRRLPGFIKIPITMRDPHGGCLCTS